MASEISLREGEGMPRCSRCSKEVDVVRTRVAYNHGILDAPHIPEKSKTCIPCIKEMDRIVGEATAELPANQGRGE